MQLLDFSECACWERAYEGLYYNEPLEEVLRINNREIIMEVFGKRTGYEIDEIL